MVRRAEAWPWSSLSGAAGSDQVKVRLEPSPVAKPKDWAARVNARADPKTLDRVRLSVFRGRPFGDDRWTKRVAKRHGLESTLRDPWRPKKETEAKRQ